MMWWCFIYCFTQIVVEIIYSCIICCHVRWWICNNNRCFRVSCKNCFHHRFWNSFNFAKAALSFFSLVLNQFLQYRLKRISPSWNCNQLVSSYPSLRKKYLIVCYPSPSVLLNSNNVNREFRHTAQGFLLALNLKVEILTVVLGLMTACAFCGLSDFSLRKRCKKNSSSSTLLEEVRLPLSCSAGIPRQTFVFGIISVLSLADNHYSFNVHGKII